MYKTEYYKRRMKLIQEMKDNSLMLLTSGYAPYKGKDQVFSHFVTRGFYYLTGLQRENFVLLIVKDSKNAFEYLFIEEPSDYATKWLGRRMTKAEASLISGISLNNILYLNSLESFVANRILLESRTSFVDKPNTIYLDLFRQYLMKKPFGLERFQNIIDVYPELNIEDLNSIVDNHRRIKSEYEVNEIKKAINYTLKGIQACMNHIKPEMNEKEIEALFEYTIKINGSKGTSFNTIAASGKNATVLHYEDNNSKIKNNTLILTDLGALSNEYAADITRTYPANGKFTERQKEYYSLVLEINKTVMKLVKPGVTFKELNAKANDMMAKGLLKLGKIKEEKEFFKYYYHSIGHYLGLDVHDVGNNLKALEPGVIITIEPGVYVKDEEIGIRIEDDVLVTENGFICLSKDIIKEIDDIEEFMKK